jgi:Na+/proline symporter
MTVAELAELRYDGVGSKVLRAVVGFVHAVVTNGLTLSWVLLAAAKNFGVFIGLDRVWAVALASGLALTYSVLAGLWGVVLTDLVQFTMAMVGALALAWLAWSAVGGGAGLREHVEGTLGRPELLDFAPTTAGAGPLDPAFWTAPVTGIAVALGVAWWANQNTDGGPTLVQRVSATRDEREGMLAALWFQVAHYALRPWPWIMVALASIVVLPHEEVRSPVAGVVAQVAEEGASGRAVVVDAEGAEHELAWAREEGWYPVAVVDAGGSVAAGEVVARTDSEAAYPAMIMRFLPVGLLGLVVASLLAAFMSTVDTHVNLASSFFVNDLYRRFLVKGASPRHYVLAARLAGAGTLVLGALIAISADSIRELFVFVLRLLAGVGPVYALRWLWWRIGPWTELVAMLASMIATFWIQTADVAWELGPLSPGGELSHPGGLVVTVAISLTAALVSLVLLPRPDPSGLTVFYRKVRPMGAWGPVRALCPDVEPRREFGAVAAGVAGGLMLTFGLLLGTGWLLLARYEYGVGACVVALGGELLLRAALARIPGPARR